jgi:cytochrome c peroxidase
MPIVDLRTRVLALGAITLGVLSTACSSAPPEASSGVAQSADDGLSGKQLFEKPLSGTNGRSCATCHVASDGLTLTPAHVSALYAQNPGDPLFNRIDADDETAAVPTFEHLKRGLVRITLTLADNLDVIDGAGNVITNADRTVFVWRGVPSTYNVAYTAPYQLDGRAPTLAQQADGALHAHMQIDHEPSPAQLDAISDYEGKLFSSEAARKVANDIDHGRAPAPVDLKFPPGSDEAAGQAIFLQICAQCHGTGTTNTFTNRTVEANFFPVQHADGTIDIGGFTSGGVAIPTTFRDDLSFPTNMGTYGISATTLFAQLGIAPQAFPDTLGVPLPHYRIRFYTDASRTQKLVDLPPPPPAIGVSLVQEPFSVDPGRALISGDPYDWEGFDVPQLRGLAETAPYFHDNSMPDLHALIDIYSRFILQAVPALNLGPANPPEGPGLPPEVFSPLQKQQLFAFLQQL